MEIRKPPSNSLLEFYRTSTTQTVVARGEGINRHVCLLILPGIALLFLAAFCWLSGVSYVFTDGENKLRILATGVGMGLLLTLFSVFFIKSVIRTAQATITLRITNGVLTAQSDETRIETNTVYLTKALISETENCFGTSMLLVRVPTFNITCFNRFLRSKAFRFHNLVSHTCPVIQRQSIEEMKWLMQWIDANIEALKATRGE